VILRMDIGADKRFLVGQSIPSRRHYPRVEKPHGVWSTGIAKDVRILHECET
jgi:hypothetical protein